MTPQTDGAILVSAEGIARSFGRDLERVEAVQPSSFLVRSRDRIAIVGRSGSGKSTLLQMIGAIEDPSEGVLAWPALGDKDVLRPGKVAMMFQAPSLIPTLDVLENVSLPLALLGQTQGRDAAAHAALRRFGLADLAPKLPEELSGGQAQRVALARAIVGGPALLLLDEPTGQLDQITASGLMGELIDWADETGAALMIATHDPKVAANMIGQWQMDHGRLVTA